MSRGHWILFAVTPHICASGSAADLPGNGRFGNLTEERVLAERDSGESWLVNGGRFSGEHYSPLGQISERNVASLGLAWTADIPSFSGHIGAEGSEALHAYVIEQAWKLYERTRSRRAN